MRKSICLALLCVLLLPAVASARNTEINIELLGGYTLLVPTSWDIRVDEIGGQRYERKVSDDSEFRGQPMVGVGFSFSPKAEFYHFRYGFEVLAFQLGGTLKGTWTSHEGVDRAYDEGFTLQGGLLNMNVGMEFGDWAFRPYIFGGIGALYTEMDLPLQSLDDYGVAFNLVFGGDYLVLDWLTIGIQFRISDYLGLQYKYDLDNRTKLLFEPNIVPFSSLLKVGFRF